MDPFERQWGDLNRQYAEHKAWVLTPIIDIVEQHLATFIVAPLEPEPSFWPLMAASGRARAKGRTARSLGHIRSASTSARRAGGWCLRLG